MFKAASCEIVVAVGYLYEWMSSWQPDLPVARVVAHRADPVTFSRAVK